MLRNLEGHFRHMNWDQHITLNESSAEWEKTNVIERLQLQQEYTHAPAKTFF